MKKTLRNLVFGTLLVATGAGIATPIAYNVGEDAGRESAKPVKVEVHKTVGPEARWWKVFDGASVIDASGERYSFNEYMPKKIERVAPAQNAYINTATYHDHCIDRCDHDHTQ